MAQDPATPSDGRAEASGRPGRAPEGSAADVAGAAISGEATCPLDDVIVTHELTRRPSRPPDYEAENRALTALAQALASDPGGVLQKVVETARVLCRADSTGVSILEPGGRHGIFRWHAIAGPFASNLMGTVPREDSPCGIVMERNEVLLFAQAERYFPGVRDAQPRIHESLLVPWSLDGEPVGTLWLIAHTPGHRFDAEDARLLRSLARFASAAWQTSRALAAAAAARDELERRVEARTLALHESEERLAADLAGMRRLHGLHVRIATETDLKVALDQILEAACEFMATDRGCVQFVSDDGERLEMFAALGYPPGSAFIEHFLHEGSKSACDAARRGRARLVIDDVETFEPLAGTKDREVALAEDIRATQSTPMIGHDGKLQGVLSNQFRVPHRPSEEQLRLIDLLAWTAADFVARHKAEAALHEADQRKNEFLATLAHELRNPLAPIRNALRLLRSDATGIDRIALHATIERQVNHMVRLVDDLLDVARISRGIIELRREPLDLREVLRTAVETSRPAIERGRHALTVELPGEPLPVEGDAVRLAQVFANLLNNAARYGDDGGRIELAAHRDGEAVVASVRDRGIGIAPEQLPRLFEIFGQLDRGHARSHSGLGIGLHLAQRLAQMHGGSVQAASAGAEQGSTFTVRLPLAAQATATAPVASPEAAIELQARRVLIVDDNRDSAETLAMLLATFGAEMRVAHDGVSALALLEHWRPSAVLLDIGMPGMDGYEVARRIRADVSLDGVMLVALTDWGQATDRQRTSEAGFDHHLTKPVDLGALQALLAALPDSATPRDAKA